MGDAEKREEKGKKCKGKRRTQAREGRAHTRGRRRRREKAKMLRLKPKVEHHFPQQKTQMISLPQGFQSMWPKAPFSMKVKVKQVCYPMTHYTKA